MNPVSPKKYNRSGFTLIELLTVIAIIGILAAIIIPSVGNVKISANKAKTRAMFSQWALSMDLFKNEYGYYPAIGSNTPTGPTTKKIVFPSFFAAMTSRDYLGAAITTTANLYGNTRKLTFYTPTDSEVTAISKGDLVDGSLKDAFGNTDFAVFTDTNSDGIINSSDALTAETVTIPGASSGFAPNSSTLDTTAGVRAGVIFYSAGKGTSATDIVTSW